MVKKNLIALLLLGLAGGLLAYMSWQGEIVGLMADDAIYIVLADYFSPYSHELRQSAAFVANHGLYPLGYPVFLALFGADSNHLYYAHVLTTFVILAGCLVSARYLLFASQNYALVVVYIATIFLLPRTLLHNLELMSEPLYLLLSILALAKYESLTEDRDVTAVLWIAVLISLATLTRTAGIALLFAFIIWQFFGAGKNRMWRAVLIATVPLLLWEILKAFIYSQQPMSYSQDLVNSYNFHDIPALLRKLEHHFLNVWEGWRKYIDVTSQLTSLPASILLCICMLPALLARLAHFRLDAIYFVLYLAMILIWPYTDHTARFLYPIIPLAIFYVMLSISWVSEQKLRFYLHGLVLGLTILGAAPSTAQILYKAFLLDHSNLGDYAKTRTLYNSNHSLPEVENDARILRELAKAMQIASTMIPKGDCAYATHFEMFMYFGRRYSRPVTGIDLRNKTLEKSPECRFLFVNWTSSHPYAKPGYPLNETQITYRTLYQHSMSVPGAANDKEGIVAELVLLLPAYAGAIKPTNVKRQ